MSGLTKQNRELVMTEVRKQLYAINFAEEEIDLALASSVSIFSDFEQRFVPGLCGVFLRSKGFQSVANFALELVPGLVYAHRFFGDSLPQGLKQKLTNPPQTHDTLFELICLGAFQRYHVLQYEPKLEDGKVPDLVLSLPDGQSIYVECKSQRIMESKAHRLFDKVCGRIHKILDIKNSTFIKQAWENDLRSEIHLSHTPSNTDLNNLQEMIDSCVPSKGIPPIRFGDSISLLLIPREQPFNKELPTPSSVIQVGTTPTAIDYTNAHVAVYPWPGLDTIRRRSQRKLLTTARHKFRTLPHSAYGLICIQTFSSKKFVPDIHKLLQQKEFERIPIVWLNPIGAGQVMARNDALELRNQIFGELMRTSKNNANKVMYGDE